MKKRKHLLKDVPDLATEYPILIYWSEENAAYIAECPQLQGCRTHGDTYEAALKNGREAVEVWLEGAIRGSHSVPEPMGKKASRRRQLILRVDPSLQARLQMVARAKNRSVNELATSWLSRMVETTLES